MIPKRYYRTHVDEGMDNMTQMDYITAQDNATMTKNGLLFGLFK